MATHGDDPRRLRRREQAESRRRRRRRDAAFWSVIAIAVVAAVAWAVNPGWSLRGPSDESTAQAVAPSPTGGSDAPGPATTSPATTSTAVPITTSTPAIDTHERDHGLKASGTPARTKVTVPVLMYHRVAPPSTATNDVSYNLTVSPAQFRQQMKWLRANGYTAISQAELFRAIEDGAKLPPKPVVITFDDGYVDAIKDVLPVLQPMGWPATFFIITSRIGERAFLDATQLRRLSGAGMDIGSHTVDHLELTSLDDASEASSRIVPIGVVPSSRSAGSALDGPGLQGHGRRAAPARLEFLPDLGGPRLRHRVARDRPDRDARGHERHERVEETHL